MRCTAVIAALSMAGCSFVLVKDVPKVAVGTDPAKIACTSSSIVPGIDAIAGAGAVAAAAAGIIRQHTSDDGSPKHFDLYYAGPLVLLGIIYFVAASGGTDRVETCQKLKEHADDPNQWQVKPIDPGPKKTPQPGDIELGP